MPLATLLLLFLAGLAGGFIDSIAGGGGLITFPALLAMGLPPRIALGTNKLQSSCGTSLVVARFHAAGLLRTPWLGLAMACALLASMAGALAVSVLSPVLLKRLIPWMLAAIALYTALCPRFGLMPQRPRFRVQVFAPVFGLALGFYDGFFGPGVGSFWTVACVMLLGLDLRMATGYTKAANLASNVGALAFFVATGSVNYGCGTAMIAGNLAGARLGSGLVIRRGAPLIRPVFLAVVFALTAKLIWDGVKG